MDAHDISEDEAREIIARVASQLTIDTGGIGSKMIRIRSNPGFPVSVSDTTKKSLKTKRKLRIEISGIDNIKYIPSIDTYINAFLSLCISYDKVTSILPDVETTCNLTQADTITGKDVLSANDKNLVNKQELIIDAEKDEVQVVDNVQPVSFDDDLNTKNVTALDLIYGSDGEDEDYGDYEEDDYGSDMEGGNIIRQNKKDKQKEETQ